MPAMIDWITAKFRVDHFGQISHGRVVKIDPDGCPEWESRCWKPLAGSHESSLQVKTVDVDHVRDGTVLQISGNPVKWFQGHNLFGSQDVHGLCMETITRVCDILELHPTEDEKHSWHEGDYSLSRVDVNTMYSLGTREHVLSFIRDLEQTASTKIGAGIFKGTTLYFNSKSRRWQFKAYSKGQEIEARGHNLPAGLSLTELAKFADDKLRLEFRLMHLELDRLRLTKGRDWKTESVNIDGLHAQYLERIDMNEQKLSVIEEQLPKKLLATYLMWKSGQDLRQLLSKNTFYRHRQELLDYGINISKKQPAEPKVSNVVPIRPARPFIHLRDLVPCEIPEWAKGTALYFEPRKFG